jgi:O-antigen ligase
MSELSWQAKMETDAAKEANTIDASMKQRNRGAGVLITSLIILALFGATLLILPNGMNLRLQPILGFTFLMTSAAGIYILAQIDVLIGALILWACFQIFTGGPRNVEYVIFALSVFYIAVVKLKGWREDAMYDFIMLVATVCVGFQVLQLSGIHYPFIGPQLSGITGNQDDTSCLLAVSLPAFLRHGKWRWVWIPILGLFLAKAWMGIVAVDCVLIFMSLRFASLKHRACIWAGIVAMTLAFQYAPLLKINGTAGGDIAAGKAFDYNGQKIARLHIWEITARASLSKAWTGWGFMQYQYVVPMLTALKYLNEADRKIAWGAIRDKAAFLVATDRVSKGNVKYFDDDKVQREVYYGEAHNDYVEWMFTAGIPALGILLLAILWNLALAFYRIESAGLSTLAVPFYGLAASCVCAMFFFSWQLMPVQAITVFYLGAIHGGNNV